MQATTRERMLASGDAHTRTLQTSGDAHCWHQVMPTHVHVRSRHQVMPTAGIRRCLHMTRSHLSTLRIKIWQCMYVHEDADYIVTHFTCFSVGVPQNIIMCTNLQRIYRTLLFTLHSPPPSSPILPSLPPPHTPCPLSLHVSGRVLHTALFHLNLQHAGMSKQPTGPFYFTASGEG